MTVLITGASGFVGAALTAALTQRGIPWRAVGRAEIGEIGPRTDWRAALDGATAVVHLAGIAHRHADESELRRVNTDGTGALAAQAAQAGVQRFVFLSSSKAAADRTEAPLAEGASARPTSAYGRSKRGAEEAVLTHARLQPVALRAPLVCDADAKANFAALLRLAASGAPLPFAGLRNRRSLIARAALTEAILAVLAAPRAPTGVFHVADRPALATGEIAAHLRAGMGRPPGLFAVPSAAFAFAPRALTESLELDDSAFRAAYGYGACAEIDAPTQLRAIGRAWAERR